MAQDTRQLQVYVNGNEYIAYLLHEKKDMTYFGSFQHEGNLIFGTQTTTTVSEFMDFMCN